VSPTLRIAAVEKRLAGRPVLRGVDLEAPAGAAVALLGANGAGKSTLLRVVAGVLAPDAGTVTLGGDQLLDGGGAARRRLGYVPEHPDALPHLTVRELLVLVAALKRAAPPERALVERLGADAILDQRTAALSLGQRRRAFLAAALVGDPVLLLLDEPTNGLDPGGIEMLATLLRERVAAGGIVLFATHDVAFAEAVGGRRVRIEGGRLHG
jgi:ABC-type multidrug transport system ATPase subunit